jgi:hypothetical protein
MKKIFISSCTLLIIVSIITSCEKENYEAYPSEKEIYEAYPKKYVFTDIIYGEVNSYTNSGNKNEPDKIYSFLENFRSNIWGGTGYIRVTGSLLNIYEEQSTNIPFNLNDEIELISESKAKITSNDTVIIFDIIRKDGILYFQSLDTISGYRDITDTDNRPYYIKPYYYWNEKLKNTPLYIDTAVVTGIGGSITFYRYKPCIYALERKNEIQISYTCYIEKNMIPIRISTDLVPEGYYYEKYFGAVQNIQNDFNPGYLLSYKMGDNLRKDTIVYKTNAIIFKKTK